MILETLPNDFSSAYSHALYGFAEALPSENSDIEIWNSNDEDEIFGMKRFRGSSRFSLDISNYLCRKLNPVPYYNAQSLFFVGLGRTVEADVRWGGDNVSPSRIYTSSLLNHSRLDVMRSDTLPRRIARGEWDEISFPTNAGDTLVASITLRDESATVVPIVRLNCSKSLYSLLVNASHLIGRSSNPSSVRGFDIRLGVSNVEIGRVAYDLVDNAADSMRLAWLNRTGGYDYDTFSRLSVENVQRERRTFRNSEGEQTLSTESALETVLSSGDCPAARLETISVAASSPRVWRVESGGVFTPMRVVDSKCVTDRHTGACSVRLTVCQRENSRSQRF